MTLLDVYHRLPYPGRCLAASFRGLYLRLWRYGRSTPRLVEEALAHESWTMETWRRWQDENLAALLERAVTKVPFYRDRWRGRPAAEWHDLARWPVLRKEEVRRNPRAFLAEDRDPRRLFPEHTSGSTGTPLTVWWSRSTAIRWYALVEARLRRWHGVSRANRWAILGGQLVAPVEARRPPFWVWNAALRQLYLSSYHLEPGNAGVYLEALARHRVRYLMGYASALAILARLAREEGARPPRLRVVISNAEPLYADQRRDIEAVFDCPVRDTYGAAELAVAAGECEAGSLHLWPEAGIVEVMDDERDVLLPAGQTGRLICTGLLNPDMPLVRYEIGDRGALALPEAAPCSCGRLLPVLAALEGRLDDVVITPEGRRVGRLDPVFKAELPLREAQIVQTRQDRVVLRLVPAPGWDSAAEADLVERLQKRLGPAMEITVEEVERLPRGRAGKLRAVVSQWKGEELGAEIK